MARFESEKEIAFFDAVGAMPEWKARFVGREYFDMLERSVEPFFVDCEPLEFGENWRESMQYGNVEDMSENLPGAYRKWE